MSEEIRMRKEMYRPRARVRSIWFSLEGSAINDNIAIPPGTLGTVDSVDAAGTVHVKWDNGAFLGALVEDAIEVV